MNIISGIGESGFLALSAFSAGIATKDSNGNDITATYLTGVDLTPYQTTAGMTAYLTTGDSAEFMTTAERSDYIPTGVSSEFYTTANTAGYISEVPDTYLQNTDLSTEDGKVTAISGIPLSAGGDVPEGVMVESGLEYNAVNEISAYNGSAIAQYGAEKQWLVHDDTLVHAANSAQYALGVNLSAVAQLLGVDETVLYSGNNMNWLNNTATIYSAADNFSNYKRIKLIVRSDWEIPFQTQEFPGTNTVWNVAVQGYEGGNYVIKAACLSANGNQISFLKANSILISPAGAVNVYTAVPYVFISEIIGIGRKA